MAKTLGKAGGFSTNEAVRNAKRSIIILLLLMLALGLFEGFMLYTVIDRKDNIMIIPLILFAIVGGTVLFRYAFRKVETFENLRLSHRKGAVGEAFISHVLDNLPDSYYVLNDLATPYGNLDHVVVGPNGIFVLDTKNWKGVVKADGKGDILINEKPPAKPVINEFIKRIMSIRERFLSLCNEKDVYFQPLLVFPIARVEVLFGSTKNVHCLTDEQLVEYIENQKHKDKYEPAMVKRLAKGFELLSKMDEKG